MSWVEHRVQVLVIKSSECGFESRSWHLCNWARCVTIIAIRMCNYDKKFLNVSSVLGCCQISPVSSSTKVYRSVCSCTKCSLWSNIRLRTQNGSHQGMDKILKNFPHLVNIFARGWKLEAIQGWSTCDCCYIRSSKYHAWRHNKKFYHLTKN